MRTLYLVAILLLSPVARADTSDLKNYVSADAGQFIAPGFVGQSGRGAVRLSFGVQPTHGWGVEFGIFSDTGSNCSPGCSVSNSTRQLVTLDSFSLHDRYIYPLNERISLFGKLGFAYSKYRADVEPGLRVVGSGFGLSGGLGVQVRLFKQFGVRAQYEEFGITSPTAGPSRTRYLSVGWILQLP